MTQEEEVKAFLSRGYRTKERISAMQQRIENWQQIALSITAPIKEVSTFGPLPSDKVGDCASNIVDLQSEILLEVEELVDVEREIGRFIKESGLDVTDKALLEMRYLNYMTWEVIAVDMHLAYRWVMRRHKRALAMLSRATPVL